MSDFDLYVLLLCIVVFTALTAVFAFMITAITKLTIRLIRVGAEDVKLTDEYKKMRTAKKRSKFLAFIDRAVSFAFFTVVLAFFVGSLVINVLDDGVTGDIPTIQVVNSGSMATKYENNDYLFENGLDDQIQTFDLILTRKLPKEEDLKLYDIVVYEVEGTLVIHRIIGIEEPTDRHPNERHFLLKGDAVQNADRFPVRYEQMKGIYLGERIPFLGSLVSFMQSPAGALCIILAVVAVIIVPIVDKKLANEKQKRLIKIGAFELVEREERANVERMEREKNKVHTLPIHVNVRSKRMLDGTSKYRRAFSIVDGGNRKNGR